jgi:SAM-dependent methyltransferase
MQLKGLAQDWDQLGQSDPLWAILSDPAKKGNRWSLEEFFATGEVAVDQALHHLDALGVKVKHERALDFGCGVGRLTQALAQHFNEIDGVDIAPSMIDLARKYNRFGDRCRYHVNSRDDLHMFDDGTFDFVFTDIVLQHMPPEAMLSYVAEFVRILRPGGVGLFDIPPRYAKTLRGAIVRFAPAPLLAFYRRRAHGGGMMELHTIKPGRVLNFLVTKPVRVIENRPLPPDRPSVVCHRQYCIERLDA